MVNMVLGSLNIFIDSEVWHEVVHWMSLWWGWLPGQEWLSLDFRVGLEQLEFDVSWWQDELIVVILSQHPWVVQRLFSILLM